MNENQLLRNSVSSSFALDTSGLHSRRLLVTSEEHYSRSPSGAVYCSGFAKYAIWSRYLDVFDDLLVLARVTKSDRHENEQLRADGPGVSFRPLPDHTGPWQYLHVRRQARIIARHAITECSAYLLRMPGIVSQMVWHEIVRAKKPYALEVMGDPWDALGPGTWPHISRSIFRPIATVQLKHVCADATAINYVTSETLQKRYPPSKSAYSIGFSDVSLEKTDVPGDKVQARYRRFHDLAWQDAKQSPMLIGFIGSFARMYKGPDTLLHAAALCQNRLNFQLIMVGVGRYLQEMKTLAAKLNIAHRVEFCGELSSGHSIFEFLDSIDLFVMPSRAEGLPRALVEAMSRGCPCIASAVGGIPEILDASDLVPVGAPEKLAKLILAVAADSNRLLAMSARNLAKAAQFNPETLNRSRRAFLEEVKRRSSPG